MNRKRLPNRRLNQTVDIDFGGAVYAVTVGYQMDGTPAEVFAHGAKTGSQIDLLLDDVCVALSLALQHGIDPRALAASMGTLSTGDRASVVGAVVDLLASEARRP